jgi:predicted transcriptional regulator
MRTARPVPPPLELLCLKALWKLEEGTVRQVQQAVARSRPLAYTTIMTVLDRLVHKGTLTRRKSGRAFVYATTESWEVVRRAAVRQLLTDFFDGSEEQLLSYLREDGSRARSAGPEVAAPEIDTVLL